LSLITFSRLAYYILCESVSEVTTNSELQTPSPGECPRLCLQILVNVVNYYKVTSFFHITNVS
jgi:hypothetical protein